MTTYMKKGFLIGLGIVIVTTSLFAYSLVLGLLALGFFGAWFWNLEPSEDIDGDLKFSNEEIEKELPENPAVPVAGAMTYLVEDPIAPAAEEEPDPQPWMP